LIAAAGTLKWGSQRPIDAMFAFLGPLVGFALTLALLLILPPFPPGKPPPRAAVDVELASYIYTYATLLGGLLFYLGIAVTLFWKRNTPNVSGTQWLKLIGILTLPPATLGALFVVEWLDEEIEITNYMIYATLLGGLLFYLSAALLWNK